jgi:phenylalanyl-tRNA synthetase beta chain
MKISYNCLQTFFADPLPSPAELADALTFHSSEIEEIIAVDGDTVIDVKVLPDKSAWLLSHRGVAKELSVILAKPLSRDPLSEPPLATADTDRIALTLETTACDHYSAALMTGIKVGPSPAWLQDFLRAIGQRPINNVVDAANYVMFDMGQPLHAFDAGKLGLVGERYAVGVRQANEGEKIVTLMGEEVILTEADMVVVDGTDNSAIAIAGVKGGIKAAVDEHTTALLIEAAHFDRVSVRKTAQRHNRRTDASARYENGVPRALAPIGLARVCALLTELTGGTVVAVNSAGAGADVRPPVSVSLTAINRVLGLALALAEVTSILDRLAYHYVVKDDVVTVTPPFERDDLTIAEDLIEEIGRFYGLSHITAAPPTDTVPTEINVRHYYAERIRATLTVLGFSEVMTSSFRAHDEVKIKNALASDKGYLRSALYENLAEALAKNAPHRDLLGLSAVQIFEIGTAFNQDDEYFNVGIAVRTGSEYKAKVDDALVEKAKVAVEAALGVSVAWLHSKQGIAECRLSDLLSLLPVPTAYEVSPAPSESRYQSFSPYPSVSRDIALWVPEATHGGEVAAALRAAAGPLCVRLTHIDTFTKDGRTSLAFRLVFQALDRTLTGGEVDDFMKALFTLAIQQGWEVR